jgi:hypothetical protein
MVVTLVSGVSLERVAEVKEAVLRADGYVAESECGAGVYGRSTFHSR